MLAKVGNDDVGAGPDEPLPLPFVDSLAIDLIGSDPHSDASYRFGVLDLDVAIAKGHELGATQMVFVEDALNDHLLGVILVIVQRAVDAGEIGRKSQGRRLIQYVDFVSTRGQVTSHTPVVHGGDHFHGTRHHHLLRQHLSRLESSDTSLDPLP